MYVDFSSIKDILYENKQKFFNPYLWLIILIFLSTIGNFIYCSYLDINYFNLYNFALDFLPSLINFVLYGILSLLLKNRKDISFLYFICFLFACYSYKLLYNNYYVILFLPIFLILSTVFFMSKKTSLFYSIGCIFTNLLFSVFIFYIGKVSIKDFIIISFFNFVMLSFCSNICLFLVDYIEDVFEDKEKAYKKQEILQENINKAVQDLKIEPMTGLFNKRAMNEALDVRINSFRNNGKRSYLAIIDLDFFKSVNDNYGHDVGDIVLIELANTLKKKLDKKANVFRFGGEEFVIIFDKYTIYEIFDILEEIRVSFGRKKFKQMDGKCITLSAGLTEIREGDTKDSFLKRADDALYKSKNKGRNQITII